MRKILIALAATVAAAVAAGLTTHPAYVVVCTDEAATSLMYEDNMANGAQLPKKQRLAIAAQMQQAQAAQGQQPGNPQAPAGR